MFYQARQGFITGRGAIDATSAPPASSGWGDHGTWIDLSTTVVTNDTMTSNNTSNYSTARGSQARQTGKYYCEFKLITAPGANLLFLGLLDASVATGSAMDTQGLDQGVSTQFNDGTARVDGAGGEVAGVNLGSGVTLTPGDIIGIAYDGTNGFHYLSQNGTYFLSGDPTSGASGTGHVAAYTPVRNYYPRCSIWGLVNCSVQLITGSGALAHLPSGYTAWG